MPAGMPKIEVVFLIDANGILQVTATELRTGKAAAIEVKPTYGLAEADVERMVEESFTFARRTWRPAPSSRPGTRPTRSSPTSSARSDRAPGWSRTRSARPSRRRWRRCVARATSDRDAIREATTALNHATEHLAELMMDAALKVRWRAGAPMRSWRSNGCSTK